MTITLIYKLNLMSYLFLDFDTINYRNELKNKIDRLSNLKEQLEREILIKSMQ